MLRDIITAKDTSCTLCGKPIWHNGLCSVDNEGVYCPECSEDMIDMDDDTSIGEDMLDMNDPRIVPPGFTTY